MLGNEIKKQHIIYLIQWSYSDVYPEGYAEMMTEKNQEYSVSGCGASEDSTCGTLLEIWETAS